MKKRLIIKSETAFCLLVMLIWSQSRLIGYVRAIIIRLPIIGSVPDLIIAAMYATAIFVSIPFFKVEKQDLIFLGAVLTVFLLEWLFYQEGSEYLSYYMVDFLIKILPLYIVGISLSAIENKEKLIHQLYVLSIIALITNIVYQFTLASPMDEIASKYEGNMYLAYNLLPHCCLIACNAVKKTNILNVVLTVIGAFYLLMLGTRGAALIYLLCIFVLMIIGRTSKGRIARIAVIFGAITGFLSSRFYDASIMWMYQQAQKFGLSVRIFDKLLQGTLSASSGRDVIRDKLLYAIGENPLFGYGLCGDRVIAGGYAHNIAIELWVDFGVILGSAILASVIVIIFKGYYKAQNDSERALIMALFFSSFCMMFMSGSFLEEPLPMFLLGFCTAIIRKGKTEISSHRIGTAL